VDLERRAFALRHLYVYPALRLAYTPIPKNASTSFKRTFGSAQGWLAPETSNVHVMKRSWWLSGLARYPHTEDRVVVVRDPYGRALSAYFSKFVGPDQAIAERAMATGLAASLAPGATRDDVTFADFVEYLARTSSRVLDEHWRPQSDFLVGSYTRVVRFEHLDHDTEFLAQRGLALTPSRDRAPSKLQNDLGPGWGERTAGRVRTLRRRRGVLPARENMYDDRLRELVRERFAEDVELFERTARERAED